MDWTHALPLLRRALELPAEEREAYLDQACASDETLRRRLREMIEQELDDEGFLEPPLRPAADEALWSTGDGVLLGRYRLVRPIGTGGMGEVWLAERDGADFRQRVAIKIIRMGMRTDEILRRFKHEQRVMATLSHPNIPRLIDGAVAPDGRPYLVMEFVDGSPIDQYATQEQLSIRARLDLFLRVCEAVSHAHERGIVHRDIKPSNVLVTPDGAPRLLDFGIAKALEDTGDFSVLDLTVTGRQLLTPRWASPEQVRGAAVTPATDVHALGLLLWQLLVGHGAFADSTLSAAALEDALCEQSIRRPSSALDDSTRRRAVRGDLDTICGMALRKEPSRRYVNAGELAADVRRHLGGLPVLARRDTLIYRSSRFVRRNRAIVAGTLATIVALIAGLVATTLEYRKTQDANTASRMTTYIACLQAAESALGDGRAGIARDALELAPEELRGWEWRHLASRLDRGELVASGDGRTYRGFRVRWMADDGLVYRVRTGLALRRSGSTVEIPWEPGILSFDTTSDGKSLAIADRRGQLWTLDMSDASLLEGRNRRCVIPSTTIESVPTVADVAWSPEGGRIAVSRVDGSVNIIDAETGERLFRFEAHEPAETGGRLAWHPDGRRLASTGWDEMVHVYDTTTGAHLGGWRAHTMWVEDLEFSPDGLQLATCSMDGALTVWDLESRRVLSKLRPGGRSVTCVCFLPGGDRLVTSTEDGAIQIVDWRGAEVLAQLVGHDSGVQSIVVSPDGATLASIDDGCSVHIWPVEAQDVRWTRVCELTRGLVMAPDGQHFAAASPDGWLRVWSTSDLSLQHEFNPGNGYLNHVDWCSSGERIAVCCEGGMVVVLKMPGLEIERVFENPGAVAWHVQLDETGRTVWAALDGPDGSEGCFRRWDVDTGESRDLDGLPWKPSAEATFVLDAGGAIVACSDGSGRLALSRGGPEAPIPVDWTGPNNRAVRASVDGDETCVAVLHGRHVHVVDPSSGRALASWTVDREAFRIALRPGHDRVAVACGDCIEIWDVEFAVRLVTLRGHGGFIPALAWSRDGETLLSAGATGRLRLWETR